VSISNIYCIIGVFKKNEGFLGKEWSVLVIERNLSSSFIGLQSAIMSKYYFSCDYLLTGVASSFFVCIDDQSIVENWMEVNSSAFAWNFHEAYCIGMKAFSFSFF